jgi:putative transposase
MVTAVKYRKVLLYPAVEECIRTAMKGITERYEIVIDEIGFDQNHIHIFCGAKPSMSPMQIITILKSIPAQMVFKQFPKLKEEVLWGGEFWSDGKYIGTIGDAANEDVIRRYIRNQSLDENEINRRTGQLRLFKFQK